ncbi:MAG: cobalamin biosynthesis protein P47K [Desulfitibacter sp. BRH_c19]|nr:MAG: cobalamin biosynthesis protein P47K [Desulfitibacter sp. BRH_c19]
MKVILIGGFLGSGKTTFIRYFAKYLISKSENKVVIIENEIGEVGIDDQFLSKEGLLVKELFGGCICCQLTGDLTLTINKLAQEYNPDWVIIETTGVAKPVAIINTLNKYGKGIENIHTLILADASRWVELVEIMPELIKSQVGSGDVILVNKTDEVDKINLNETLSSINNINSEAKVFTLSALHGIEDTLLKGLYDYASGRS